MSNSINQAIKIIPSKGFSFPEPLPHPPPPIITLNQMEFSKLMNNFRAIEHDFIEIKKKQKFHEILLISIVGLLSMILLVLFFQSSSDDTTGMNSKQTPKTEKKQAPPQRNLNN
jgi:flagellar biosynthesis/type III secretory pathway M-ring protein FliF/YscJ